MPSGLSVQGSQLKCLWAWAPKKKVVWGVGIVANWKVNTLSRMRVWGHRKNMFLMRYIIVFLFFFRYMSFSFLLNVTSLLEPYLLLLGMSPPGIKGLCCWCTVWKSQSTWLFWWKYPPSPSVASPRTQYQTHHARDFCKRLLCVFSSHQILLLFLFPNSLWLMFTKGTSCNFPIDKLNL